MGVVQSVIGDCATDVPSHHRVFGIVSPPLRPFAGFDGFNVVHYHSLPKSMLSLAKLDEPYHYDFTNISDDGVTFYRGGMIYNRPCGWHRFAYDLNGKYPDDIWLNGKNPRKDIYSSAEGEWPVSYHGTSLHNGLSIADEGYQLSKCKRFDYGNGIYSTPDIKVALGYASRTDWHGKKYKVVLQNRVNPKTLKIVDGTETEGKGEYWVSPNQEDVRPYGFCIKEY